jgi:hypothetical protein
LQFQNTYFGKNRTLLSLEVISTQATPNRLGKLKEGTIILILKNYWEEMKVNIYKFSIWQGVVLESSIATYVCTGVANERNTRFFSNNFGSVNFFSNNFHNFSQCFSNNFFRTIFFEQFLSNNFFRTIFFEQDFFRTRFFRTRFFSNNFGSVKKRFCQNSGRVNNRGRWFPVYQCALKKGEQCALQSYLPAATDS